MVSGGIEKELITLLKRLDSAQFDVTALLMYISDAEIVKDVPDWVTLCNLDIDPLYYCGCSSQII